VTAMLVHVTTRLKVNVAGQMATQVLSGTYMPDPFSLRSTSGRFEHAFSRNSDQTIFLAVWQSDSPGAVQGQWAQAAALEMKPLAARIRTLLLADAQNAIQSFAVKINRQLALEGNPDNPAVLSLICVCIRHNQALVMSAGTSAGYLCQNGQYADLTSEAGINKGLGLHSQTENAPCLVQGPLDIEAGARLVVTSHKIQPGPGNEISTIMASQSKDDHVADVLFGFLAPLSAPGSALILVKCLAETGHMPGKPASRPTNKSEPQPRQEHQRTIFAKPPAPKIKIEPFSFKRLFLWQVIPAWLQFWSLIAILSLIILIIWLIYR